ncbi:AOAH [Bugula neritina]|uniref:AOAH n=1 Tax=Bugula neritina TaxID=10212 RepID=A0A7J7KT49_BUGNE|nr:AOAH [Bugula neritina]
MRFLVTAVLVTVMFTPPASTIINHRFYRGIDGGLECATCTVLISLVDQLAEVNNQTIIEAFDSFCVMLPPKLGNPCQLFAEIFGPLIIQMVAEGANADDICRGIGLCYQQPGQKMCSLYPKTLKFDKKRISYHQYSTRKHLKSNWNVKLTNEKWSICDVPLLNLICVLYKNVFDNHVPFDDVDHDRHSPSQSLRGSSWRGKDCNDGRADIYPGRKPELLKDVKFDSNCNGIWGFDNKTGKSYEEQFCDNTGQRGVVVIGDSVGAHFHAPQEWFDPQLLTKESLKYLPFALENELDWPQLSLVTGYMDSVWDVAKGPTDSIYKRIRERNRCNHRNYQNTAVNGDSSFDAITTVEALRLNPKQDYPVLIVLELVGNDVCNGHPANETLDYMTTEQQMHDNLIKILTEVNQTAPADSKVLIVGMADGDFLYQFLGNRTHPFGRWRNDLTYADVYEWWNCMQVTPCTGWLSNDATLRSLTTQRAMNLSGVMKNLAKTHKHFWSNLEVAYIDCPINTVINRYIFEHGSQTGYQLIEPVDGFHPNQLGQALSAAEVWRQMELKMPNFLGPLNRNNEEIIKVFGDQGGH